MLGVYAPKDNNIFRGLAEIAKKHYLNNVDVNGT
jgi:hypothetical protein